MSAPEMGSAYAFLLVRWARGWAAVAGRRCSIARPSGVRQSRFERHISSRRRPVSIDCMTAGRSPRQGMSS
ncbi:hypothetical protein [Streptomyces sp. NPDC020951]|uniref:hypothetical protein n=1 Tax=Streptomyces sp. NPDC020951 TaxID=3365104 RepID=UPI0037A8E242